MDLSTASPAEVCWVILLTLGLAFCSLAWRLSAGDKRAIYASITGDRPEDRQIRLTAHERWVTEFQRVRRMGIYWTLGVVAMFTPPPIRQEVTAAAIFGGVLLFAVAIDDVGHAAYRLWVRRELYRLERAQRDGR